MELLLERVLIELVAIAVQVAIVRLFGWFRSRSEYGERSFTAGGEELPLAA